MEESELIYNLFYLLFCYCIVYPPTEFISLGWTVDNIFSSLLGDENLNFIRYQQKRTALTLLIHSSLPGIYFVIYNLKFKNDYDDDKYDSGSYAAKNYYNYTSITWNVSQRLSVFCVVFILGIIFYWSLNSWENHPISKHLLKFSNSNQPNSYYQIVNDIEEEYRRGNNLKIKINSISSVMATENWIIKTTPYFVYFAHQSDVSLQVTKSETFNIAANTSDLLQMININVKSTRPGVEEFQIRINAFDFKTLQDQINRPITIPSNIRFHLNTVDRFVEAFKEQISSNPIVRTDQLITDNCFACMIATPNIKIQKNCVDINNDNLNGNNLDNCTNCYCRPMWCVDCLARWFASRQNEFQHETWFEKKCSCPLCRAKFCILDVCYIERTNNS